MNDFDTVRVPQDGSQMTEDELREFMLGMTLHEMLTIVHALNPDDYQEILEEPFYRVVDYIADMIKENALDTVASAVH